MKEFSNQDQPGLLSTWRSLRRGDAGIGTRITVSLLLGCLFAALALIAAWLFAVSGPRGTTRGGITYLRVSDTALMFSFAVFGLFWLISLFMVWRGGRKMTLIVRPIICTIGLWIFTILAGVAIDEMLSRAEEEVLIAGVILLACAGTLLLWLPAVQRIRMGRPLFNAENLVNVTCPGCGYSLIGLRQLRCPECGLEFTIDELIHKQEYGSGVTRPVARPPVVVNPFDDDAAAAAG